jgi:hypothetical protein
MIVRYRMMHAGSAKTSHISHASEIFPSSFPLPSLALQLSIRHKLFTQDQQQFHTITTTYAKCVANQIHGTEGVNAVAEWGK